jgi:hypothetical protein
MLFKTTASGCICYLNPGIKRFYERENGRSLYLTISYYRNTFLSIREILQKIIAIFGRIWKK